MSSEETNYKELFANMTFVEIIKWQRQQEFDWDKDFPEWFGAYHDALDVAARREFPEMNLRRLLATYEFLEQGYFRILCHGWMLTEICVVLEKKKEIMEMKPPTPLETSSSSGNGTRTAQELGHDMAEAERKKAGIKSTLSYTLTNNSCDPQDQQEAV